MKKTKANMEKCEQIQMQTECYNGKCDKWRKTRDNKDKEITWMLTFCFLYSIFILQIFLNETTLFYWTECRDWSKSLKMIIPHLVRSSAVHCHNKNEKWVYLCLFYTSLTNLKVFFQKVLEMKRALWVKHS